MSSAAALSKPSLLHVMNWDRNGLMEMINMFCIPLLGQGVSRAPSIRFILYQVLRGHTAF